MATRKPLSRLLRFEVFKRDSFTCVYCGASAPSVILHVDHIHPVSKGGKNNLLNLVTSCESCNLGKSDRKLDDNSAIAKSMAQAKQLQDRQEQIAMIYEWNEGLEKILDDSTRRMKDFWSNRFPGHTLNDKGFVMLKTMIRKHGENKVLQAINRSAELIVYSAEGLVTESSISECMKKFHNILDYEGKAKTIGYLFGIAKNKGWYLQSKIRRTVMSFKNDQKMVDLLIEVAKSSETVYDFNSFVSEVCS